MNHAAPKEKGTAELPKYVNLFLGRCINSAYSLSPSILWSYSTSGHRVTMPADTIATTILTYQNT